MIFDLKVVHFKKVIAFYKSILWTLSVLLKIEISSFLHHSAAVQWIFELRWDRLFKGISNRSTFHHMIGRSMSELNPFQQHISDSLKKKNIILHFGIISSWHHQEMKECPATKLFETTTTIHDFFGGRDRGDKPPSFGTGVWVWTVPPWDPLKLEKNFKLSLKNAQKHVWLLLRQ